MSADWPWSDLGLDGPASLRDVKRAYAKTLKTIDRSDPEAFQCLRDALGSASKQANDGEPKSGKARPKIRQLVQEVDEGKTVPVGSPAEPPQEQPRSNAKIKEADQRTSNETPIAEPHPIYSEGFHDSIELDEPEFEHPSSPNLESSELVQPLPVTAETIDPLPAGHSVGSTDDEDELYAQIEVALETKNYKSLAEVFAHPAFQNRQLRNRVEERLADIVAEFAQNNKRVPSALAQKIEAEFSWASDAISTKLRLQKYGYDNSLINYVAVRLKSQSNPALLKKPPKEIPPDERKNTKTWIILAGFTSLLAWSVYQGVISSNGFFTNFIVTLLVSFLMVALFTLPFQLLKFLFRSTWNSNADSISRFMEFLFPKKLVAWWRWQAFDADEFSLVIGFFIWWGATLSFLLMPSTT